MSDESNSAGDVVFDQQAVQSPDAWRRMGKPLGDVAWLQEGFLDLEGEFLLRQLAAESVYAQGPPRTKCIICESQMDGIVSYARSTVRYAQCATCGHFNGLFELSDAFARWAYQDQKDSQDATQPYASDFAAGKLAEEYDEVVHRIYVPKAEFLREALARDGTGSAHTRIVDVGCGAGHFLSALRASGFNECHGFDTLASAVNTAKSRDELAGIVDLVPLDHALQFFAAGSADVVSMMCVLPHLDDPVGALRLMSRSGGFRYTFQKLPMWSFATLLEAAFPEARARVLGMDHTHVFTAESLKWIEENVGLRRVASWSFGSDALDLQRKLLQRMSQSNTTSEFRALAAVQLTDFAEALQGAIDETGLSSEIHVVWEFRR